MSDLSREERDKLVKHVDESCQSAGCSEKLRKVHREQILRRWNPHPPPKFKEWWKTHFDSNWINVVRAYNCEKYRQEHLEAKQYGLE